MQIPAYRKFWLTIPWTDAGHHPASYRPANDVSHFRSSTYLCTAVHTPALKQVVLVVVRRSGHTYQVDHHQGLDDSVRRRSKSGRSSDRPTHWREDLRV